MISSGSIARGQSAARPQSHVRSDFSFLTALAPGWSYTRADAVATYRDSSGILRQAAANQPLIDHDLAGTRKGLRFEPSRANKIGSHNASPTDWTGMTQFGPGSFSVVSDAAALALAGLQSVGNGNVWKIDNSAGGDNSGVYWGVATGNTNKHSMSIWARTTGDGAFISTLGAAGAKTFTGEDYQRIVSEDFTPANASDVMAIVAPPGTVLYFILPQLEEGGYCTGEIVTAGAAATRAEPTLTPASLAGLGTASGGIAIEYDDPRARTSPAAIDTLFSLGSLGGSGVADRIAAFKGSGGNLLLRITNGSTEHLDFDFSGDAVVSGINALGLSWGGGRAAVVFNGVTVLIDTSITLPTDFGGGLSVGGFHLGGSTMAGWVRRVCLYKGAPPGWALEADTALTVPVTGSYDTARNMVIFAGQSNSVGVGTGAPPSYAAASGTIELLGNDGVLKNYIDPYDSATNQQFGASWLSDDSAGNGYAGSVIDALQSRLGGKWCAVPANKGGTGVLRDAANSSTDGWWTETDLGSGRYAMSPTVYCAIQRIRQAMALGVVRAIVWDQGATDGLLGHDTTQFRLATQRLMTCLRSVCGDVPVVRVIVQDKPDAGWVATEYPDNNWAEIQQASRDVSLTNSTLVESEPFELQADELHFTTAGYAALGAAIADSLAPQVVFRATASEAPAVVLPASPVNTRAPVVSGAGTSGATLTVAPGAWTQSPALSYQWFRGAEPVSGATGTSYTLTAADEGAGVSVLEIPNGSGALGTASNVILVAPVTNSVLPVISGTPRVGQTLSYSAGTWSGSPTLTRIWFRGSSRISGATGTSYTLTAADEGAGIWLAEVPNGDETKAVASNILAVETITNTTPPAISGTGAVGSEVAGTDGVWTGGPTLSYQWQGDSVDISGATSANYTPVSGDAGKTIRRLDIPNGLTARAAQSNGLLVSPGASLYPLAPYKLTLPVDENGNLSGDAHEILQPELLTYESDWFQQEPDRYVFDCPDVGASTPSTSRCRTELRHLTNNSYDTADEQTLLFSVDILAENYRTCVKQIHASTTPYLKVIYQNRSGNNGRLYALVKPNDDSTTDTTHMLISGGLALGTRIKLRTVYRGPGQPLDFYINDSATPVAGAVTMNRSTGTWYWKRGNYRQHDGAGPGLCRVTHYAF